MELFQLRYFYYAAKNRNISMAAQELHVTQPSISKAIMALEEELQVELLQRKGRVCTLTREGELLQARIQPILKELGEIPRDIQNVKCGRRILINALSANLLIPEIIRGYKAEHPETSFRLMEKREAVSWDLCIRSTLPMAWFNNAEKLLDERLMIAVPQGHPLADRKMLTLEDLENVDFAVLREGGSIRTITDGRFRAEGFIPRIAVECDNFYTMRRVVAEGLGVCVCPEYTWKNRRFASEGSEIRRIPIDLPDFSRSLYMIFPKETNLRPEVLEFAEYVRKYFADLK